MREQKRYPVKKSSLIGNYYPMFLNNSVLGSSVYLYQVSTPGLSKDLVPLISLEKVGEITRKCDFSATERSMKSIDILSTILDRNESNIEARSIEYLEDILKREVPIIEKRGNEEFPGLEMNHGNNRLQVSLIVDLRDDIRWRCYRFLPGRLVDILWSENTFAVFKIEGDNNTISLSPVALYNNTDVSMRNPIPYDFKDYQNLTFSGNTKTSDLNRAIKRLEWMSFD